MMYHKGTSVFNPLKYFPLMNYSMTGTNIIRPEVTEIVKGIYALENHLLKSSDETYLCEKLNRILRSKIPQYLKTDDSVKGIPLMTRYANLIYQPIVLRKGKPQLRFMKSALLNLDSLIS